MSTFELEWLYERNFTAENRKIYLDNNYRPKPVLWSKDQFEMKEFNAADVLENDDGIHAEIILIAFIFRCNKLLNEILIFILQHCTIGCLH